MRRHPPLRSQLVCSCRGFLRPVTALLLLHMHSMSQNNRWNHIADGPSAFPNATNKFYFVLDRLAVSPNYTVQTLLPGHRIVSMEIYFSLSSVEHKNHFFFKPNQRIFGIRSSNSYHVFPSWFLAKAFIFVFVKCIFCLSLKSRSSLQGGQNLTLT